MKHMLGYIRGPKPKAAEPLRALLSLYCSSLAIKKNAIFLEKKTIVYWLFDMGCIYFESNLYVLL